MRRGSCPPTWDGCHSSPRQIKRSMVPPIIEIPTSEGKETKSESSSPEYPNDQEEWEGIHPLTTSELDYDGNFLVPPTRFKRDVSIFLTERLVQTASKNAILPRNANLYERRGCLEAPSGIVGEHHAKEIDRVYISSTSTHTDFVFA